MMSPTDNKLIAVGTTNPSKLRAVEEARKGWWPDLYGRIVGFAVSSDVSEQPLSLEETVRGATNRARAAWRATFGLMEEKVTMSVGIESGLMTLDGLPAKQATHVLDICACVLFTNERVVVGLSSAWMVPQKPLRIMLDDGVDMNAAWKRAGLTDKDKLGNEEGAIAVLSGGKITRVDYTKQAIQMALVGWRNP